jgi:DNA-binding MurR/RpiR family transcriptional regulator
VFSAERRSVFRRLGACAIDAGLSTSDPPNRIMAFMTKLLDQALEAVRLLSPSDQDEIARIIMQLAGQDLLAAVSLSPEEREAIARSKAAAKRGEFASDEQVQAVWAKHGL